MSLKLTAGYRLDLLQISRLLQYSIENNSDKATRKTVADGVGLSAARVGRLWMMGTALGLFNKGNWVATELGQIVYEHDPYLDDIGTLWLLHYILASNPDIVVWNCMTNEVVPNNRVVTTDIAKPYFSEKMQEFSELSFDVYLNKEIRSYLNAYTEQKFQHLRYLVTDDDSSFEWGDKAPLPPYIALACILHYRDKFMSNTVTIDIEHLSKSYNSLGRIINLTKRQVRDLLEDIERLGFVFVESRADLDQVRFRTEDGYLDIVRRYYEAI